MGLHSLQTKGEPLAYRRATDLSSTAPSLNSDEDGIDANVELLHNNTFSLCTKYHKYYAQMVYGQFPPKTWGGTVRFFLKCDFRYFFIQI